MIQGRRWNERDRYGNDIYLTDERWGHITEPANHPEMLACEGELRQTIRSGRRKQDALNPQKYRYVKAFDNLADSTRTSLRLSFSGLLKMSMGRRCQTHIITAYQKEIG